MHWLSFDRTTWGLILSIAAILLAFPLSMLANLATPKIRNWWAERSVAALRKWVGTLEGNLARMQKHSLISDGEQVILQSIDRLAMATAQLSCMFVAVGVTFAIQYRPQFTKFSMTSAFVCAIAAGVAAAYVSVPISAFLRLRTSSEREKLAATISKLKAKLPASPRS